MDFFGKNLEALKERSPEVVKWLNGEGRDECIERIISEDGNWNLRIRGRNGKSILLYDMENPLKENEKHLNDIDFASDKVTFILGFGLGYNARSILKRMEPGHEIVVLEKNATVLRLGLSIWDFSDAVKNNSVTFVLTDDESIKNCGARYASGKLPEDLIFVTNPKLGEADDEYQEIENTFMESISSVVSARLDVLRNAQSFVVNDLNNFPKFLFSSGINKLDKRFEKMPAFIISSGPSLEKNIHHLKRAKGRAVLFAIAPAVRVMLAHDIMPDFVLSVDFQKENYEHFKGICELDIPLIHVCTLYPQIVRDYQGHGFVYQLGWGITEWMKHRWPLRRLNNPGGSVALHAFIAAIAAGCDPIIFVGQDLAHSKKTYAEGVALATDVDISSTFCVKGIDGEKVLSDYTWVSFLRRFEEIISSIDRKCINSTEGGAAIKGTQVMPLKESIEKYCQQEIPVPSIIKEISIIDPVDYKGIIEDIQKKIYEISGIQTLVPRGLKTNKMIANRIKGNKIEDPKTDHIISKNSKIVHKIRDFCEGFELVESFLHKDMLEFSKIKYEYESGQFEKRKEIEIGVKRNRVFLEAMQKALRKIKSELKHLLGIVTEANKLSCLVKKKGDDPAVHHEYGRFLSEIGLHRLAIKEYEKSLKLKETADVHLDLVRSYLVLEKIEAAKQERKKYLESGGDDKNAVRLQGKIEALVMKWRDLAEDYYHEDNWINALLYTRKLDRAGYYPEAAGKIISECIKNRNQKISDMEKRKDQDLVEREEDKTLKELISKGKELMNNHNLNDAIELLRKAVHEYPEEQDTIEAKSLMACCYSEKKEIEKAGEIYSQLMERYPDAGIFHVNLGKVYLRNGLYEWAIKEYEAAVAKEERFYILYFEIGCIYMQRGEYSKAIESFEKYLKYSPDSYELIAKIGTCYLAKGMPWKAKGKYQEALKIQSGYEPAQVGLGKIEEIEQRASLKGIVGGSKGMLCD